MKFFGLLKNERSNSYVLPNSSDEIGSILSNPVIDGVFGVEIHKHEDNETRTIFTPQYFKLELEQTDRDKIFDSLEELGTEFIVAKFFLGKPSMFPIDTNWKRSLYDIITNNITSDLGFVYQLIMSFRQDDWKGRLVEQYQYYLDGVENPYESDSLRKLQKKINDSVCNIFNIDYKHNPIREIDKKIDDKGFMYSVRLLIYGGSKKQMSASVKKILDGMNEFSYVNKWFVEKSNSKQDVRQIIDRSMGKNKQVLSASEIMPLIVNGNVGLIKKPKDVIIKQSDKVSDKKSLNLLSALPHGKEIEESNDVGIANRFIKAIADIKKHNKERDFRLVNSQSGSTLMRMTISIPENIRLSEITKKSTIDDIQSKMGVRHLQIKQGDNSNEINVILPLKKRHKVFLKNYIDNDEFRKFSENNNLPFLVGVDEIGNPIYQCLNKSRHILVAGTTGSGKSVWINQLILTLLLTKSPSELMFYMVDVKRVELSIYKKFPHVKSVITDADESISLLAKLKAEMERRYEILDINGFRNINAYNAKNPNKKIPYIVCVIDEYAELALRNKDVHEYVQEIAQLSRASGIHLIIATQDPRKEVIPPIIKSNLPSKIGLRCSNVHSYMTFLNSRPPFNLLGNGDGVMAFEGQMDEFIRFQGCLIVDGDDEEKEREFIEGIAEAMNKGIDFNDIKIEDSYVEDVVEDDIAEIVEDEDTNDEMYRLKSIIATTGETRVSMLRDKMRVNINRLNSMMKQLVDEGWLEKPEYKQQGYKLILNEEELEKWR